RHAGQLPTRGGRDPRPRAARRRPGPRPRRLRAARHRRAPRPARLADPPARGVQPAPERTRDPLSGGASAARHRRLGGEPHRRHRGPPPARRPRRPAQHADRRDRRRGRARRTHRTPDGSGTGDLMGEYGGYGGAGGITARYDDMLAVADRLDVSADVLRAAGSQVRSVAFSPHLAEALVVAADRVAVVEGALTLATIAPGGADWEGVELEAFATVVRSGVELY